MSLLSRQAAPTKINKMEVLDVADGVELSMTSLASHVQRTEINHPDNDYTFERNRALTKMTTDGLKPLTDEEIEVERKTTKQLLKKFTTGILKLDSNALSFPILYSEPRSYLERCADIFSFLVEIYINKAIQESDNEKKLAYIAAGIIASFHIDIGPKKVFNPYLGETYCGKWENGAEFYAEQSSHHPPISDMQIFGPDNKWNCYSHMDFSIDSGLNNVELKQNGTFRLDIKDGPSYEWKFPMVSLSGFLKGDRIVKMKGTLEIHDVTNNLVCIVEIAPKKDAKKGLTRPKASTLYGGIKQNDKKVKEFSKIITGDYCEKVMLDDEVLWDINTNFAHRPLSGSDNITDDSLLPSDSRFRFDRVLLINGKLEEADKAKTALEELQRREEKLRESVSVLKNLNFKLKAFGKKE